MIFKMFRPRPGPRNQRAALLLMCLIPALTLALGQATAGLTAPAAAAVSSAAALRAQVGAAGWVTVRVALRASSASDDLEQTAQDLLFTLPAGSYDGVTRAAGSASLTVRVDAGGLDALLGSPWAASVAAADTPEMQRLATGYSHSLALKPDGSLWAWGSNGIGQLGDGTTTQRSKRVQVLTGVAAVAAGWFHTLAIKTDGSLWAWGSNGSGELGDGTTTHRTTPVQVLTGVAAVSAGDDYTLAIKTDGSLWAWGRNDEGQLGDGTTTDRTTPVQVLTGVAAVSAGYEHTLAIKTDGSLWAWGDNWKGRLGDGTAISRHTPVQILTGVAAVSVGLGHTLAIKTDGSLWAWGWNQDGQLGNGATSDRHRPLKVLTGVAAVSAGYGHSLAIKTDGSLWAWGHNWAGQLGDGTTHTRYTPVQILAGVAAVSTRVVHTLARKTDGSLWAWGKNRQGELGNGSTMDSLSPVPVVGFGFGGLSVSDFVVTDVTLNPSDPLAGGTFNAAITVKNRGTLAGSPGLLRVWAHQRATQAQACAAPGDAEISLETLAAGATQTVRITLPAGTAGYRTLWAFIDSQCETQEPDESNNQFSQGYRVLAEALPDFTVTAIDLTPNRPTAGGTFSAAVTVQNRGTAAGEAGTLALWVDQPGVPACGAAGDAAVAVGPLAAGASRTLTLDGLPAGTAAAKSLRAFIDAACVSAEAHEGNNQRVKPYTVVP